jgi:DNA-binding response OmpR family regulator
MNTAGDHPPFTVLIVEDDRIQAGALATYFRVSTNYRVEVAHDAEAAIASARRNPPDVAIVDIGLPDKDGLILVRELTDLLPKKPLFLALTGHPDLADRLFKAGFQHYYLKPADPTVLETVIRLHEYQQRSGS